MNFFAKPDKHKKFSMTEERVMEIFSKEFYSDFILDYQIKTCNYHLKKSDKYSFGNNKMYCDFRDRCFIDIECKNCGRIVSGIYKESNCSFKTIMLGTFAEKNLLTCDEYLIRDIIK